MLDEMSSSFGLGRDHLGTVEQFVFCLTVWNLPTFLLSTDGLTMFCGESHFMRYICVCVIFQI